MANIGKDVEILIKPIIDICKRDNDAFCAYYFSREQDRYSGGSEGMEGGDALLIIDELIEKFNLDRQAIGRM